jgi:hypothetical protein
MYSRDDKRFIAWLVATVLALLILLRACEVQMGYRGPYVDDGRDLWLELEER